jgi:predicted transposase YdaD
MRYDITLKSLFHGLPERLLELLTGHRPIETLTVEYPTVQRRLPDLVLRLDNGSNYHLELQSDIDPEIAWRMLEYYSLICRHDDRPLQQQVLYVGSADNTLAAGLQRDRLRYEYDVIDMREIDGELLLRSPSIEDNILALLCRLTDERDAVRALLARIGQLDANARADALEKVVILAGLRNLKPLIEQEIDQMPITVDIMQNPFLREAFDKGRQEGEHVLLVKQLEQRFGPLPDDVLRRLETAAPELLEQWGLALLAARTLDEVFH